MEFPTLETDRLVLREHRTLDDTTKDILANQIVDSIDDAVTKNTTIIEFLASRDEPVYTLDDAKFFLKDRKEDELVFAIYNRDTQDFVGTIGVHHINKHNNNAELGYWMSKHHRGKGFISEAVEKVLNYCFDDMKMHRLEAYVYDYNIASSRVLEKNGFKKGGTRRELSYRDGEYHDAFIFDILSSEFKR
jgi:ribosomal-protein-alanine N-acetyltransferase